MMKKTKEQSTYHSEKKSASHASCPEKKPPERSCSSTLSSSDDDKDSSSQQHQEIYVQQLYHSERNNNLTYKAHQLPEKSTKRFSSSTISSSDDSSSRSKEIKDRYHGEEINSASQVQPSEKKSPEPFSSSTLSSSYDSSSHCKNIERKRLDHEEKKQVASEAPIGEKETPNTPNRMTGNDSCDHDEMKKRREKRLAMNRESARKRRKLKAELIEGLQKRVFELTNENEELKARNNVLENRVGNRSSSCFSPSSSSPLTSASGTESTGVRTEGNDGACRKTSSLPSLLRSSSSSAPSSSLFPLDTSRRVPHPPQQQQSTFQGPRELLLYKSYEKLLKGGSTSATSNISRNQEQEEACNMGLLSSFFKNQAQEEACAGEITSSFFKNQESNPSSQFSPQQQQRQQDKKMMEMAATIVNNPWLSPSQLEEKAQRRTLSPPRTPFDQYKSPNPNSTTNNMESNSIVDMDPSVLAEVFLSQKRPILSLLQQKGRQDVTPPIDVSSLACLLQSASSSSSSISSSSTTSSAPPGRASLGDFQQSNLPSGNNTVGGDLSTANAGKLWVIMQKLAQQKQAAIATIAATTGITLPPSHKNNQSNNFKAMKNDDDTMYRNQTVKVSSQSNKTRVIAPTPDHNDSNRLLTSSPFMLLSPEKIHVVQSDLVQNFLSSSRKYLMHATPNQTATTTTATRYSITTTSARSPHLNSNDQRQTIEVMAAASLLEQARKKKESDKR